MGRGERAPTADGSVTAVRGDRSDLTVRDDELMAEIGVPVGTDLAPGVDASGRSPALESLPAGASAAAGGAPELITPPGTSKQAQRATELANTVYVGVKQKMSAMKAELTSLREGSARLQVRRAPHPSLRHGALCAVCAGRLP